jgi:PAS domain S-box-containing protein
MRLFSGVSLKYRLLLGGLLCAMLTGLSGGAGILSLRMIHSNMQATTEEIGDDIASQNDQVNRLINFRSMASEIASATRPSDLHAIREGLEAIRKSDRNDESLEILDGMSKLTDLKGEQLEALENMELLRCRNIETLEKITNQALTIGDDTEFETAMQLEGALQEIRSGIGSQLDLHEERIGALTGNARTDHESKNTAGNIEGRFKKTAMMMDQALSTVKAAFTVRFYCSRLHAMMMDTLTMKDVDMVSYRRTEFQTLLGNTIGELDDLPGNQPVLDIRASLKKLDQSLIRLIAARIKVIRAEAGLARIFDTVYAHMNSVDETTLEITGGVKRNAEAAMSTSTALVNRWQNIEILLVCGAFILAIVVGVVISSSVTRQIQSLNNGMNVVGEGNLDYRVETGTSDEIGRLAKAFDKMTEKLSLRETAVKESEQRFRRLFEQSNDGIILHDLNGMVIDVNERMVEMVGYDRDSLLAGSIAQLHTQEDLPDVKWAVKSLRGGARVQLESHYVKADGGIIDVDLRSSVIDAKERVVQTVVRDITQRKRAEKELQQRMREVSEANSRLEVLVSNTTERELCMVQLKREINGLLETQGSAPKYEAPAKADELVAESARSIEPGEDA